MSEGPTETDTSKCKCGREGLPDHTCPYGEEINGDYDLMCNCCENCEKRCARDI